MNIEPWHSLEQVIIDQLDLQVELSFSRHHEFMLRNGLTNCSHVLDLGTGNGRFLSRIAAHHPEIRFYGIDDEPYMIDAARNTRLQNVIWQTLDVNNLVSFRELRVIDGILMRYFLLHLPNVREILNMISKNVRKATKLWIFDLDMNQFFCDPHHQAFDQIKNLVQRFCDRFSIDSMAASRLPELLRETGFEMTGEEVEPFNNRQIKIESFKKFLSQEVYLFRSFLGESPDSSEAKTIDQFIWHELNEDNYLVRYGMVMIVAIKV